MTDKIQTLLIKAIKESQILRIDFRKQIKQQLLSINETDSGVYMFFVKLPDDKTEDDFMKVWKEHTNYFDSSPKLNGNYKDLSIFHNPNAIIKLYVGQSMNLLRRITEHCTISENNRIGSLRLSEFCDNNPSYKHSFILFSFSFDGDVKLRIELESELMQRYKFIVGQ